jgi:hypothetical protein
MTISQIRKWLDDKIVLARQNAAESHKTAMNSYGAGYDCGFKDALEALTRFVNGEEE